MERLLVGAVLILSTGVTQSSTPTSLVDVLSAYKIVFVQAQQEVEQQLVGIEHPFMKHRIDAVGQLCDSLAENSKYDWCALPELFDFLVSRDVIIKKLHRSGAILADDTSIETLRYGAWAEHPFRTSAEVDHLVYSIADVVSDRLIVQVVFEELLNQMSYDLKYKITTLATQSPSDPVHIGLISSAYWKGYFSNLRRKHDSIVCARLDKACEALKGIIALTILRGLDNLSEVEIEAESQWADITRRSRENESAFSVLVEMNEMLDDLETEISRNYSVKNIGQSEIPFSLLEATLIQYHRGAIRNLTRVPFFVHQDLPLSIGLVFQLKKLEDDRFRYTASADIVQEDIEETLQESSQAISFESLHQSRRVRQQIQNYLKFRQGNLSLSK